MDIATEPAVAAAFPGPMSGAGLLTSLAAVRGRRAIFDSDEVYRMIRNQAVAGLVASTLLLSGAVAVLFDG